MANISSDTQDILEPSRSGVLRFALLALGTLLVSIAVILFGSPLFQTLGFEYSGVAALALSLTAGVDAALGMRPIHFGRGLLVSLTRAALLASVPLIASLVTLLWMPNCALEDGLIFYVEIAVPSALLAGLFGFGFRLLFQRRRYGVVTFLIFWLVTALLSLLPGYTNPQLYSYGWQYGYFPGFIWDRAIELRPAYLALRLENLVWAALLLSVAYDLFFKRREGPRFIIPGMLVLATAALFGSHDNLGITASQSEVQEFLSKEAYLGSQVWVYYASGSLTAAEVLELQHDVPLDIEAIRSTFDLRPESDPIHIYIYPGAQTMERLVGTRAASFAKPWLGEVHLMKSALGSLKHELTHVVLRTIGSFPFYASWSTGLTEGAAVAMQAPDGALFTTDELASQVFEARMSSGIAGIMQFNGFASDNSYKSYMLSGSFARFLLKEYGARKFKAVYSSRDFDREYGKPLSTLEAEWKRSLAGVAVPLDSNDLARLHAEFGGPSILNMPCVRRLGKLERVATIAFEHENYGDAYHASMEAYNEGGGASDAWDVAHALVLLGRLEDARRFLDTATIPEKRLRLSLIMADLDWMAGDTAAARSLYSEIVHQRLNAASFFSAYDRLQILNDSAASAYYPQYLSIGYRTLRPEYRRSARLLDTILARHQMETRRDSVPHFDRTLLVLLYIQIRNFEQAGWLDLVPTYDPATAFRITAADSITSDDSLAISIVERRMWRYREPSWLSTYIPKRYQNAAEADRVEAESILRRTVNEKEERRRR